MKLFDYLRPNGGHSTEAKLAFQKFDHDELHVLKKTWQDLADRSNGKGIDKETFLQYFPLHGLLGERLFAQFDSHKRGYIDFDEFIMGLATVGRGSTDDKIHFVFNMYDVSHDSTVSKQELSTLLNHIPRDTFAHASHHSMGHGLLPTVTKDGIANVDSASESEKGSVAGDAPSVVDASEGRHGYEDEVDNWTNQDLVEKAFEDCDINNEGRLNYEAFKMWVMKNPQIMDYIQSILPYAGPKDDHRHSHKKETLPHLKRIQSRMSLGRGMHSPDDVYGLQRETSAKRNSLGPMGRPRLGTLQYESGAASPAPMSPFFHGGTISRNSSFSAHATLPPPLVHTQSGTPINRAPSVDGTIVDSEEQARQLLAHAMSITQNAELRAGIQQLIDTHLHQYGDINGDHLIQLDRMNTSDVYNQFVTMENYLWKKGKSVFHLLSKRYYLLAGNCMYYYAHKDDVRVKGVVFLTGCIIERKKDEEMELRGYFGFEITHQDLCTGEHHRHETRTMYCRSEEEREKWVTNLQHAAHVVPIEDDYVLGKELGRGRFSVVCECVHKLTNKHCAVKIIDKATIEPDEKALLRTEIAVLKLVNHPNIIRLEGLYESKQYLYIVMEMLKGGELFERIVGRPRFTEGDLIVNPNVWGKLSEDAKSMILQLLTKNTKDRITARDALKHPFIVNTLAVARRSTMVSPIPPTILSPTASAVAPPTAPTTPAMFAPTSGTAPSAQASPSMLTPSPIDATESKTSS
eukprot:gene10146-7236_t